MWNVLDWWSILETSDDRRSTREIIVVPFRSIDSPLLMALTLTEASSKLWLIGVRDQPDPKQQPQTTATSHQHHKETRTMKQEMLVSLEAIDQC